MLKLTPRQAEILAFIKRCLEDNGYPPTRAEIAQELGFKSPNAAEEHLKALARKGAIEMTPGASRGIRIPGFEAKADDSTLPIIGRVAAGSPILAQEQGFSAWTGRGPGLDEGKEGGACPGPQQSGTHSFGPVGSTSPV